MEGRRWVLRHGADHHSVAPGEGVGVLPDADLHRLLVVMLLLLLTLRRRWPLDLNLLNLRLLLRLRDDRLEADCGERLVGVEGGAVVVHDPVDGDSGLVLVGVDRRRARCPRGQNADLVRLIFQHRCEYTTCKDHKINEE